MELNNQVYISIVKNAIKRIDEGSVITMCYAIQIATIAIFTEHPLEIHTNLPIRVERELLALLNTHKPSNIDNLSSWFTRDEEGKQQRLIILNKLLQHYEHNTENNSKGT